MKVLVTGSSGHLGEALVKTLRGLQYDVVGIDILPSSTTNFVGSIANRAFVKSCMSDVVVIFHTATLHKPHIESHSKQDFIDTNITGTLNLLEEAIEHDVPSFIFTSTTSVFGDSLMPSLGDPAVWITEDVAPVPKNIYGVTKLAAEDLCQLFFRNHGISCIILRTSRFFPEDDDDPKARDKYTGDNLKLNEFLHRRVEIADVVDAHILAWKHASSVRFRKYIISATTPFSREDLSELVVNAKPVVAKYVPEFQDIYEKRGYRMYSTIGRVYDNERARVELGWSPSWDFRYCLRKLEDEGSYSSDLAQEIGVKGYHRHHEN